jgi:quinol monooxygenase YgiN
MMLSIIKILPSPEKRKEVLDILISNKGPIQANHSCLACSICDEEGDIVYIELWRTGDDFVRHIRSDLYTRILGAMELSRKTPEVSFFEIKSVKGMELIEAVRNPDSE